MKNLLVVVALSSLLIHCAKKDKSIYVQPAPTTEAELGFIVTATEPELNSLKLRAPQAAIRGLSKQHNLFEIQNVSEQDLAATLSQKTWQKNTFMKEIAAKSRFDETGFFRGMNTSADAVEARKTCRNSSTAPVLNIDVNFNVKTMTIELGQTVNLRAVGTANPQVGGDLRYIWDMLPADFSEQGFATGIAESQSFKPDNTGLYRIAVIAQGLDLSCSLRMISILVTANPEISKVSELKKTPDVSFFKHILDIKADRIWNQSKGSGVIVAVIDSGLDYNHPGIRENLAFKQDEKIDGADEDNNGLPDDSLGWDFVNGDRFPFDDAGHGTHVSGLVASPLSGIAPEAKIMPLKVLDAGGRSDLASVVAALYYAVDNGAQIINASLGFDTPKGISPEHALQMKPKPLVDAFEYARSKNVLILSAAGNGDEQTGAGFDIETRPTYPAAIDLENTITVAATSVGQLTSYSNFSGNLVQIAAPGGDKNQFVWSLAKQNSRGIAFIAQAGTSMATPLAAGLSAALLAANPSLTPNDIKQILIETGDDLPSLFGKTLSGKQVNAESALKKALDLKLASALN